MTKVPVTVSTNQSLNDDYHLYTKPEDVPLSVCLENYLNSTVGLGDKAVVMIGLVYWGIIVLMYRCVELKKLTHHFKSKHS